MKTLRALLAGAIALGGVACQRQNEQTDKKLDYLITKVEGLEKKIAAGGIGTGRPAGAPGAPGQMPPQQQPRRGPDPAAIYAVDITGAHYEGPATAKVTIVEAFEFA
jgi:hypothetical protein